jgi:hypothetical protein
MNKRAAENLVSHIEKMNEDAAGVWDMDVIYPQNTLAMLSQAMAGDRKAERLLRTVGSALKDIKNANPQALCLLCPHPFERPPAAFVILSNRTGDALANCLCIKCATKPKVLEAVAQYYRDNLFGDDMRMVEPWQISQPATA